MDSLIATPQFQTSSSLEQSANSLEDITRETLPTLFEGARFVKAEQTKPMFFQHKPNHHFLFPCFTDFGWHVRTCKEVALAPYVAPTFIVQRVLEEDAPWSKDKIFGIIHGGFTGAFIALGELWAVKQLMLLTDSPLPLLVAVGVVSATNAASLVKEICGAASRRYEQNPDHLPWYFLPLSRMGVKRYVSANITQNDLEQVANSYFDPSVFEQVVMGKVKTLLEKEDVRV